MSSLIPDTSKVESTDEITDKEDHDLTKKRRSFIPVENKLETNSAFETEAKETADSPEPETDKSKESANVQSVASGESEDSDTGKDSEEQEVSGSAEGNE